MIIKILLTAINAKYIHSNPALRSIAAYCGRLSPGLSLELLELSINNEEDMILSEIFHRKPDILCFSCYIWNISIVLRVCQSIRKILPNCRIILGGPEVSFEGEYVLKEGLADFIVSGEGEQTALELFEYLVYGEGEVSRIKGIVFADETGKIFETEGRPFLELSQIPFPYTDTSMEELENKIIYYEASRGCPFSCEYCLSSAENHSVRFLSLNRVYSDMAFFLCHKVKLVKFVDRTFNCNKEFAKDIWQFLLDNKNGITGFHFEISADLLDTELISLLKRVPKGLFQFEIGVQSTNMATLKEINRKTVLEKSFENIKALDLIKTIPLHLDLIAGLPYEDSDAFKRSFNEVYALKPNMLQLGFLKLLKGSPLRGRAAALGIVYKETPPYEVLFNEHISFEQLLALKEIEALVDMYYNPQRFANALECLSAFFDTPFDFYESLAQYFRDMGYFNFSHKKVMLYTILYEYSLLHLKDYSDIIKNYLKLDLLLSENIKTIPPWAKSEQRFYDAINQSLNQQKKIESWFGASSLTKREIYKQNNIEHFDYDVLEGEPSCASEVVKQDIYILFNYKEETHFKIYL